MKNLTLVFNDVDTVPYTSGLIDYNTTNGTIKFNSPSFLKVNIRANNEIIIKKPN